MHDGIYNGTLLIVYLYRLRGNCLFAAVAAVVVTAAAVEHSCDSSIPVLKAHNRNIQHSFNPWTQVYQLQMGQG